jgi:lipopolysaccharide export LptBFGC system permease protein LptF
MKKLLSVMLTAVFTFGIFSSAVLADDGAHAPEGMEEAVSESIAASHYDFNEGSVHLEEVQEFHITRENENFTYVAAVAHYETVRDDWYITDHATIVYYDLTNNKVVDKSVVADVAGIADYQKKHKESLGAHMHWDIIFYIHLLVLIIPALIFAFYLKRLYSTTDWQVANNVLGHDKSFN